MLGTQSFIDLGKGRTHYRLSCHAGSDLVVLLHGFSVGSFVWEPLEARLIEAGHSTLIYDMYGHGFSANGAPGRRRIEVCAEEGCDSNQGKESFLH